MATPYRYIVDVPTIAGPQTFQMTQGATLLRLQLNGTTGLKTIALPTANLFPGDECLVIAHADGGSTTATFRVTGAFPFYDWSVQVPTVEGVDGFVRTVWDGTRHIVLDSDISPPP